jgi:hypothetical protein
MYHHARKKITPCQYLHFIYFLMALILQVKNDRNTAPQYALKRKFKMDKKQKSKM